MKRGMCCDYTWWAKLESCLKAERILDKPGKTLAVWFSARPHANENVDLLSPKSRCVTQFITDSSSMDNSEVNATRMAVFCLALPTIQETLLSILVLIFENYREFHQLERPTCTWSTWSPFFPHLAGHKSWGVFFLMPGSCYVIPTLVFPWCILDHRIDVTAKINDLCMACRMTNDTHRILASSIVFHSDELYRPSSGYLTGGSGSIPIPFLRPLTLTLFLNSAKPQQFFILVHLTPFPSHAHLERSTIVSEWACCFPLPFSRPLNLFLESAKP
jgi:hypothetical protein